MLGLLRSPMVLMMLFTGVMMFALPKLIVCFSCVAHGESVDTNVNIRQTWIVSIQNCRKKWQRLGRGCKDFKMGIGLGRRLSQPHYLVVN